MNYKKYLVEGVLNPSIFKNIDVKNDIINNKSRYEIAWFCQDQNVTSEMIYNLFDEAGMNILKTSADYLSRVNAVISCGKSISKLFDNEIFLGMLLELNSYYFYFKEVEALKFIDYCIINCRDNVVSVFNKLNEKSQIYVIDNCDLTEFYSELLVDSKLECSKRIIEKIGSLDNYEYNDLFKVFDKDMVIPIRLLNNSLVKKLSSIYNVRSYRKLVNALSKNNDISDIEVLRKKYYDSFFDNCLNIYNNVLEDIKSGNDSHAVLNNYFNSFGGLDPFLQDIDVSRNIAERLRKSLNYITSEIVVDYLFQDCAYNVFLDINELLRFSSSVDIISGAEKKMYSDILSLDSISISDKKELVNKLKGINVSHKFYDDYKLARDKMIELYNSSILNMDSIKKYRNDSLSQKYGVSIYDIDGDSFNVLVKALDKMKSTALDNRDLYAYCDGASFSIDGSSKLRTYSDTKLYYNLVYNCIPDKQLVHVFEVDSFSSYFRNVGNNLPCDMNGTDRINRLYTPKEVVEESNSYNELVISQPNKKDDEFNVMMEQPVPFAIYCYDEICENDILSAKNTGLGIIVVRTNKYDIDYSNRVGVHSRSDSEICYVKPDDYNDISRRRL